MSSSITVSTWAYIIKRSERISPKWFNEDLSLTNED